MIQHLPHRSLQWLPGPESTKAAAWHPCARRQVLSGMPGTFVRGDICGVVPENG